MCTVDARTEVVSIYCRLCLWFAPISDGGMRVLVSQDVRILASNLVCLVFQFTSVTRDLCLSIARSHAFCMGLFGHVSLM